MFLHTRANSKSIEMIKNMILVRDFMGNSRISGNISSHCIGSKAEGTSKMESYTDDLFIWKKNNALSNCSSPTFHLGKSHDLSK